MTTLGGGGGGGGGAAGKGKIMGREYFDCRIFVVYTVSLCRSENGTVQKWSFII